MENKLTKAQVTTILQNAPKGSDPGKLVDGLVKRGYILEGFNEPKSTLETVKDVAVGFGKGVEKTGLNTLQNLQTIGQGAMLAVGIPAEQVAKTGFQSLDTSSPQGKRVEQAFTPTNQDQNLGANLETGAELLAGGGAGLIKDAVVGGTKLVGAGVAPVLNVVKPTGERLFSSAFSPSVKEAESILAYEATKPTLAGKIYGAGALEGNAAFKPITTAETALRSGIAGTEKQIGVQAKQVADNLYKKVIVPAVQGIKGVITKEELFAPLQERITKIIDPSKQKAYQNAFESLIEDYASRKSFTFPEAQSLKSELAQFTPAKVFRGQDVANETRMLQADMASYIRNRTYEALKDSNIRQKYIDYGNLQELQKVGVKAISDGGLKGGFGGFWSTIYDAAMSPIKTIGGKVLYKIGDKLQVTAPKGFEGKSFGDYLRAVGYLAPQVTEKVMNQEINP